jgi:hypothetical protein
MKIHSILKSLLVVFLFATITPALATANPESGAISEPEARATVLKSRLDEIKTIDKAELTREERKELRREVREIKKELAAVSGGVYLSIGAILLIALLLILLL